MPNTLTDLIPDAFAALDIVSRERTGFIRAVTRNTAITRHGLNDTVRVPIAPAATAATITPGTNAPDTGDQTITNTTITLNNARQCPVRWEGEETRSLQVAGTYGSITVDRFAQAFRTLSNEIDDDLADLYTRASRAAGTAGTTPFGTADDLSDTADLLKILDDNGAPPQGLRLILSNAAMQELRSTQSSLFKVNEAGSDELLRTGHIGMLQGFAVGQSGSIGTHTNGTGSGYLLNDASSAVGDTAIEVDTGSGTILAGDVVTFAGTADQYVVGTALSGTSFSINAPGLIVGETNNDAITVAADHVPSLAFHESAIILATRAPAEPEGGDAADDVQLITDPVTGLTFELRMYREYRRIHIEVGIVWGVACIKPEHTAILLG